MFQCKIDFHRMTRLIGVILDFKNIQQPYDNYDDDDDDDEWRGSV